MHTRTLTHNAHTHNAHTQCTHTHIRRHTHFTPPQQDHNYLQTHIAIAEKISQWTKSRRFDRQMEAEFGMVGGDEEWEDYIEQQIGQRARLDRVLRLACLLSLTRGLRAKKYEFLCRELIHSYGYPTLFTLHNLRRLNLFRPQGSRSWAAIRKSLRLVKVRSGGVCEGLCVKGA